MAVVVVVRFLHSLFRKKVVDEDRLTETRLSRCLSTLDLTALGKLKCALRTQF